VEFGSDSFLDIIANIVGILIILIVIAGVKVARQPPDRPEEQTAAAMSPADDDRDEQAEHLLLRKKQLDALRAEADRLLHEAGRLNEQQAALLDRTEAWNERSQELTRTVSQLRTEQTEDRRDTQDTRHELESLQDETTQVVARIVQLTTELDDAEQSHHQMSLTVELMEQRQDQADRALDEIEYETLRLQEVLDDLPVPKTADVDRLTHRLSPVARSTSDQEIHFRLSDGRIAWVPLEPLVDQLKDQVRSRGSVISRFGRYEGVVGPTSGFLMKYTVERQPENPMQALSGRRSFQVGVSRWVVRPADTLRAESVEHALRIGSQFRQVLEAAEPDTTVTVWLYADGFEAFGPLREFAHSLGLRVAARPLPDDAEITGSPAGSKSSAQ